ncbi:(d)CMP kinase [Candidatus Annandia pinicola]|uniref:(d)CMP kinase n=1 Tax=Candidatus Annandia pinicola TaxID=1345117 RepID=UPI001EF0A265|nr:(d)CMP kinase [Candidatus Annandia pinicola]UDG80443.1 Cytidylate kinase [Candidatus Annandia pinicola]
MCQKIALELKWNVLNSGALYRLLAFFLNENNKFYNLNYIKFIIANLNVEFVYSNKHNSIRTKLHGVDVSDILQELNIGSSASYISSFYVVRRHLVRKQHKFCKLPGLVADGRDMGTVVFPNAVVKFFLYSDMYKRTYCRLLQLKKKNPDINFKQVLSDLKKRDKRDLEREVSHLEPALDSIKIDSTDMSVKELFDIIMKNVYEKLKSLEIIKNY